MHATVFRETLTLKIGKEFFKLEAESPPMVSFTDQDGGKSETIVMPRGTPEEDAIPFVEGSTQACKSKETERVGILFRRHDICPALAAYALSTKQHRK